MNSKSNLFTQWIHLDQLDAESTSQKGYYKRPGDERFFSSRYPIGITYFSLENIRRVLEIAKRLSGGVTYGVADLQQFMVAIYEAKCFCYETRHFDNKSFQALINACNKEAAQRLVRLFQIKRNLNEDKLHARTLGPSVLPRFNYNIVNPIQKTTPLTNDFRSFKVKTPSGQPIQRWNPHFFDRSRDQLRQNVVKLSTRKQQDDPLTIYKKVLQQYKVRS